MSLHDWQHASQALAWSVVHFVWQGMLIAVLLALWLWSTRGRSSNERYLGRCTALLAMAIAPLLTFLHYLSKGQPTQTGASPASADLGASLSGEANWLSQAASDWIAIVWAIGAGLLCLRLLGGCWQVLRLRRRFRGIDLSPAWQTRFRGMCQRFGVRATARVVESASVAVPTVIGCFKPVVLLPARIFTGLSEEQIEALVAHELAHIARYDYLVNIAQSVVEALLFYHPAVWWVSQGIRVEREYCCDDRAIATTHDGLSYARALTALEGWRGGQLQLGVSTLGGSLMHRIQRLVGQSADPRPSRRPMHALGTLVVFASLGASAFGLARFTGPESSHDCQCCCHHQDRALRDVQVQRDDYVVELRNLERTYRELSERQPRVENVDRLRLIEELESRADALQTDLRDLEAQRRAVEVRDYQEQANRQTAELLRADVERLETRVQRIRSDAGVSPDDPFGQEVTGRRGSVERRLRANTNRTFVVDPSVEYTKQGAIYAELDAVAAEDPKDVTLRRYVVDSQVQDVYLDRKEAANVLVERANLARRPAVRGGRRYVPGSSVEAEVREDPRSQVRTREPGVIEVMLSPFDEDGSKSPRRDVYVVEDLATNRVIEVQDVQKLDRSLDLGEYEIQLLPKLNVDGTQVEIDTQLRTPVLLPGVYEIRHRGSSSTEDAPQLPVLLKVRSKATDSKAGNELH